MSRPSHRAPDAGRATVVAATSFVLAAVGAVAFVVLYGLGPDAVAGAYTQWLGAALATALLGTGVGLVTWAQGLMPAGPDVEEREFPAPRPDERRRTLDVAESEGKLVGRRRLLGRLLAGSLGALGLAVIAPLRSLGPDPFPERVTTGWFPGVRLVDEDGHPVHRDDLETDSVLTVFPAGRVDDADSQTVLLRLRPEDLAGRAGVEGAPDGYLAFSKVCTHAGCPVGLYQVDTQHLLCPCHQSAFDVLDAAKPVFGPAPRPLPSLPLAIDDEGYLVARDGFDRPVGPGFWTYPAHVRGGSR